MSYYYYQLYINLLTYYIILSEYFINFYYNKSFNNYCYTKVKYYSEIFYIQYLSRCVTFIYLFISTHFESLLYLYLIYNSLQ